MDPALRSLIDRLNRLSEQFEELREGVRKAIDGATVDPEMALIRSRKVLEYVIRDGRRIEVETLAGRAVPKRRRADQHIGCPLEWLKRVLPLAETKEQLAVAIWLHRRRVVCQNELFTVPNKALREDLGLSRQVKYATLQHLEEAGAIALLRDG